MRGREQPPTVPQGTQRFANKTVIVTGAASGIGRAIALAFANEGARVASVDMNACGARDCVAEIERNQGTGIAVECDVSREAGVENMVEQVKSKLGGIDILVSNAAIFLMSSALNAGAEDWQRVFANNVSAGAMCARYAAPSMRDGGGGAVVIVASISGLRAEPGFATYSCSKAALVMLARSMAVDLGPWNIRVNSVSPGPVDSPVLHRLTSEANVDWNQWSTAIANRQCIRRMVQPEDIAQAVMFLASDQARMITGVNLVVDGGYTAR
jgi:NAD(P)-dependent dehydrogenase (short-subunit alcohol dehydrogenase family)